MQTDKVPVCDQDGQVIGIVVMCQDITERKRAEQTLLLLNSAVLQSKESILITDAELELPGPRVIFVNPAFTKMTGYTAEETIGKTPRILQGPQTDKTVLSRLRQNLERGEVFEGEAINYRKDGTEFDLEWQVAPIRNASGTITHFLAMQRDITVRKRLEAKLAQAQKMEKKTIDLNRLIVSMEGMFHHLMGGDVDTQIVPGPDVHAVRADAGQLEQVIMNMAINARDAMPNGGKFMLETANVSFDQESVSRYPELKSGDYVMLALTDTGTGMSAEVKARIFEPFFSTKAVGQGTGLGLSTCYGIIKQSGGHISVYSELARGATFKIYLPQVEQQAKIPMHSLGSPGLPRGTETNPAGRRRSRLA